MTYSPTVRRRRLSLVLRQYRLAAGMHADEAAKLLGWTPSKVTRIERNEWKLPSVRDVRKLLDVYGVTDEQQREATLALAREARQRGWWEEYRDALGGSLPEWEAGAAEIRTYEALVIPGLLQTADYARAVFQGGQVLEADSVERRVEARLARQEVLNRPKPPILWAVIDEAALAKHVGGPAVMREQIRHITTMAARPNIGIQVIPNAAGAHSAMAGAFTLLRFEAGDPDLVHVDTATGDLFLEGRDEVALYTLCYDHVRTLALSPMASVAYLDDLIRQLK